MDITREHTIKIAKLEQDILTLKDENKTLLQKYRTVSEVVQLLESNAVTQRNDFMLLRQFTVQLDDKLGEVLDKVQINE